MVNKRESAWLSCSSPMFSACYVFSNSDKLGKVVRFPTICFLNNLPKGSNCGGRFLDVKIWLTRLGPLSYFTSAPSSCKLLWFVALWCTATHDPESFKPMTCRELIPISCTMMDTSSVKWEIAVLMCSGQHRYAVPWCHHWTRPTR